MMKKIIILINRTFILCILLVLSSCGNLLDVKPETALTPNQVYRNKFDADAAVIGIYGQFLGLAKQYVVLNELRADLMDVTANADISLRDINLHRVSENNPYADPRPFYKVILNCNDVLKNFDIMLDQHKILKVDYDQRYSDIATLRSWIYFQLALHFGNIPYVTDPFITVEDLKEVSRFPMLNLDQMIDELITFLEQLPYKDVYSINNSLYMNVDTYNTRTFFINKKFFLGDLHLWKGNYLKAATYYKDVMMIVVPGVDYFDSYRIKTADVTNHNDLSVGYVRNQEQDYYSLIDSPTQGWRSMFIRPQDGLFNSEWIWALPFEGRFNQSTPFVELFSIDGVGKYLLKPSQLAMDNWNSQTQINSFPWDQRGRFTCDMNSSQPVIRKYTFNYSGSLDPLNKTGKWFLSRAATLHLRFCEAANRDTQYKVAWALLNQGISITYNDPNILEAVDNSRPEISWDPNNVLKEFDTFLPYPYNFAARSTDVPSFRDTWHRSAGIRGRAYLRSYPLNVGNNYGNVTDAPALMKDIEDKIISEASLELAYEGNRWSDLVRVAIRRNDNAFLADKIYMKLKKAGYTEADEVRAKLMDRSNWFLPFKWE